MSNKARRWVSASAAKQTRDETRMREQVVARQQRNRAEIRRYERALAARRAWEDDWRARMGEARAIRDGGG